jgi:hypothetical protein
MRQGGDQNRARYPLSRLSGGEGGIRTHGTLITFSGFQDRRIQPLCHLSKIRAKLLWLLRLFARPTFSRNHDLAPASQIPRLHIRGPTRDLRRLLSGHGAAIGGVAATALIQVAIQLLSGRWCDRHSEIYPRTATIRLRRFAITKLCHEGR